MSAWDDLHPETRRLLDRRRFLGRAGAGVALTFLGMTVIGCSDDDSPLASGPTWAPARDPSTSGTGPTLYERLGG
jgi:hypothetical protein